jgi:hypothetical protein
MMRLTPHRMLTAIGLSSLIFFVAIVVQAQSQNRPIDRSLLIRPAIVQDAGTPGALAPSVSPRIPETLPAPSPVRQTALTMEQPVIDEGVSAPDALPSPDSIVSPNASGAVRKAPPIKYDTDSDARRMYASGSVNMIMVTENPADHCVYEIPLCIPACVTGEPAVNSYCGLMGRGVVEYCWPGGFEVKVRFRNIGDIRVDYEGD